MSKDKRILNSLKDYLRPFKYCILRAYAKIHNYFTVKHLLKKAEPLKVELGAAGMKRDGWISIDLSDADIMLNLITDKLPFPDNSVDYFYSSHVFEHFSYPEPMLSILKECYRSLKPQGIFSIAVPDASIFIEGYAKAAYPYQELYLPAVHFNGAIDVLNYIAYMDGEHKYMFETDNLLSILGQAGFHNIHQRPFDNDVDLEERKGKSIYAIGEK